MSEFNIKEQYLGFIPVVLTLNGVSFKSFTKEMDKPFDKLVDNAMKLALQSTCKDMKKCFVGYTYSDKAELILFYDKDTLTDCRIMSLVSSTASKFTKYFNKYFVREVEEFMTGFDGVIKQSVDLYKKAELYQIKSAYLTNIHMAEFRCSIAKCEPDSFEGLVYSIENDALKELKKYKLNGNSAKWILRADLIEDLDTKGWLEVLDWENKDDWRILNGNLCN